MSMRTRALGGIELRGVDELRRSLDPRVFNRTMAIAHRRAGLRVRREARQIVPGTTFDRAIHSAVLPKGLGAMVFTNAAAGESIHEGRPAGKPPSLKALSRWIKAYGMAGVVSLKTRRAVRRKDVKQRDVEALAWRLQQGIRGTGTKAIEFLTGALGPSRADVERYWREALEDTVKHFAGKER